MVRHIVAWDHRSEFNQEQRAEHAKAIKERLEGLRGIVEGMVELKVYTGLLPTGNRDMMLTSLFACEEALAAYQIHEKHKEASAFVRSLMENRACLDYWE